MLVRVQSAGINKQECISGHGLRIERLRGRGANTSYGGASACARKVASSNLAVPFRVDDAATRRGWTRPNRGRRAASWDRPGRKAAAEATTSSRNQARPSQHHPEPGLSVLARCRKRLPATATAGRKIVAIHLAHTDAPRAGPAVIMIRPFRLAGFKEPDTRWNTQWPKMENT